MLRLFSFDRPRRRAAAAVTPLLILLAACSAAPPPAPAPACPKVPAPAATPAATAAATAPASATTIEPVKLQPQKSAVDAGLCAEGERRAAEMKIDSIAAMIRALPQDMSPADAVTDLITQLRASPCYGNGTLVSALPTELRAARAWTIARWWEQGGRAFFKNALRYANAFHSPPSLPKVLAAELLPAGDPLRTIVCPTSGAVCDPSAQGSAIDIERELERIALLQGTASRANNTMAAQACAEAGRKTPGANDLAHYIDCVGNELPRRAVPPDARYRSPTGWIVLRGQRGRYEYCDEIRAYDVETGAAYIATRCNPPERSAPSPPSAPLPREADGLQTQVGTLAVDALRRLALALWLKNELQTAYRYALFPLPEGIPMPDPRSAPGPGTRTRMPRLWGHAEQTLITFEIIAGDKARLKGNFQWPDSSSIADQLIDELVVSAEATLQRGCPGAPLPAAVAPARPPAGAPRPGSASEPDAEAPRAEVNTDADALAAAFAGLRKTRVCRKK